MRGMTAIYDPANPPPIFDGLLDVYSTCRDCGTLMKVVTAEQHSHPGCATVQTKLESLGDLLVAEIKARNVEQAKLTDQLMAEVATIELGEAATTYAEQGWPVFPLAKQAKTPAIPKHKGGNGFKDATNKPERIKRWWSRHPEHNIGLATGHCFDVIDIDTKDSAGQPDPRGVMSFMDAIKAGDIPEVHAVAVTASGGMHLYVKPTGRGNYAGVRQGIDYRGMGGYVVAPPSLLPGSGRGYGWLVEPSPIIKEDYK